MLATWCLLVERTALYLDCMLLRADHASWLFRMQLVLTGQATLLSLRYKANTAVQDQHQDW